HACKVARALGMAEVLVPPYSGVLSAVGIGVAEQRVVRQRGLDIPLHGADERLRDTITAVTTEAAEALEAQHGDVAQVDVRIGLRVMGSDTVLDIDYGANLQARFSAAHAARFGFVPGNAVHIQRVTATARTAAGTLPSPALSEDSGEPSGETSMWVDGAWREVPYYDRELIGQSAQIAGPALVLEATTVVVIEPGWKLSLTSSGALLLTYEGQAAAASQTHREDTAVDPRRLSLFNHRFMSIAEHMGATLEQTSHSVNIKERRDYSCAVFDAEGRLVANAPHIPVHLGSMSEAVKTVLARRPDIGPKDAVLVNDPYAGGTHLPDLTVVTPVFIEDRCQFFVASRGHHADIGGITPGSMPAHSRHIQEEGIAFDAFPLVLDGVFQRDALLRALQSGPYPARQPERNLSDIQAQLAANQRGVQLLESLVADMGIAVVQAYMGHVRQNARAAVESLLLTLQDGHARLPLDDGCHIEVRVQVDRENKRGTIDFTGTSSTQQSNLNAPTAVVTAAVLYVFRMLTGQDIPLNSGCLEPLDLIVPEDTMLSPTPPAAVVAGNVETSQVLCDALLLATAAMSGSQGTMNNLTFGNDRVQYYETIAGGSGAGPGFDGESGVQVHMTNSRLTDPEVLEARLPVRVREFSVRKGSGGDGTHHGGNGVTRVLEFTEAVEISLLANRRSTAAPGLGKGEAGSPGQGHITHADGSVTTLTHRAYVRVEPGATLHIQTPGGGGWR
ncbi:MAG: hydantoinase B/oxoprolinase family protein, partial [Myxococcota bacterium]|nr:hydantoinase B/oxoprolinase family protein [Myxococcota bacterium]